MNKNAYVLKESMFTCFIKKIIYTGKTQILCKNVVPISCNNVKHTFLKNKITEIKRPFIKQIL